MRIERVNNCSTKRTFVATNKTSGHTAHAVALCLSEFNPLSTFHLPGIKLPPCSESTPFPPYVHFHT